MAFPSFPVPSPSPARPIALPSLEDGCFIRAKKGFAEGASFGIPEGLRSLLPGNLFNLCRSIAVFGRLPGPPAPSATFSSGSSVSRSSRRGANGRMGSA